MRELDWIFLLAQNASEKSATVIGIALFGALMFFLVLDSTVKGKFIPKDSTLRKFLIFVCVICALVLFFLLKFIY